MFLIAKEYNGVTANKTLWQVLTRPLPTKLDAETWLDFFVGLENKKRKSRRKKIFILDIANTP